MVKIIKLILKYILQCKGAGTAKAKFEMQSRTEAKLHDFEIGGETTVGVRARNEAPHVAAAAQHGRRDSVGWGGLHGTGSRDSWVSTCGKALIHATINSDRSHAST